MLIVDGVEDSIRGWARRLHNGVGTDQMLRRFLTLRWSAENTLSPPTRGPLKAVRTELGEDISDLLQAWKAHKSGSR